MAPSMKITQTSFSHFRFIPPKWKYKERYGRRRINSNMGSTLNVSQVNQQNKQINWGLTSNNAIEAQTKSTV